MDLSTAGSLIDFVSYSYRPVSSTQKLKLLMRKVDHFTYSSNTFLCGAPVQHKHRIKVWLQLILISGLELWTSVLKNIMLATLHQSITQKLNSDDKKI
jgi:hypothetical protein